VLKADNLTTFM